MLLYGRKPTRWRRAPHFLPRASYEDPTQIPTCCGPWHKGANHFVTFYLCPEYWTLLDPYDPTRPDRWAACETHLYKALTYSFTTRGLPVPALPTYKHIERLAIQQDDPLPAWSCGTFAMSTTLNLLLGATPPHLLRPSCITRVHMLNLHKALLTWLLTGTPPPLREPGYLLDTIGNSLPEDTLLHLQHNIGSASRTLPPGRLWHPTGH